MILQVMNTNQYTLVFYRRLSPLLFVQYFNVVLTENQFKYLILLVGL